MMERSRSMVLGGDSARRRVWFRLSGWLALVLILGQPVASVAQGLEAGGGERRLQPGDGIIIGVPGRSDLSASFVLDAAGAVTIEQVGAVSLGGLTVVEAQQVLRQRLRLFYPSIDAVEVRLQSGSGITLYVIGQVATPGDFEFVTMPSLFELMRTAGGPTDTANLRGARLVRPAASGTNTIQLDLTGVMEGTNLPGVELRGGDTLVIPALAEGVPAVASTAGIQVFGAVIAPTVVPTDEPMEMIDVLMQAGSPTTTAKLQKVWWVHRAEGGAQATEVDVRSFMREGDPLGNPIVYPGDTVQVEESQPSWFVRTLPIFLGIIATTATVALAYDRLAND